MASGDILHENEQFAHVLIGQHHSGDSRWFGQTHAVVEPDTVTLYQFDTLHKRELAEITLTGKAMDALVEAWAKRKGVPFVEITHVEGASVSIGTTGVAH